MDMSWSWGWGHSTSTSARLALLFAFLYPFWFAISLKQRRHTGALLPLLMPPLLITTAAAWIGYAHVVQGMSLANAGVASIAWGLAEVLSMLVLGAIVTMICTGVALIAVARTRYDAIGAFPRAPIVITVLCWLASGAATAMAPIAFPTARLFAIWNISLTAAFISLALLVPLAVVASLAHRIVVPRRAQLIALTTTLVLALIQTAVAWKLIEHYRLIALGR